MNPPSCRMAALPFCVTVRSGKKISSPANQSSANPAVSGLDKGRNCRPSNPPSTFYPAAWLNCPSESSQIKEENHSHYQPIVSKPCCVGVRFIKEEALPTLYPLRHVFPILPCYARVRSSYTVKRILSSHQSVIHSARLIPANLQRDATLT